MKNKTQKRIILFFLRNIQSEKLMEIRFEEITQLQATEKEKGDFIDK